MREIDDGLLEALWQAAYLLYLTHDNAGCGCCQSPDYPPTVVIEKILERLRGESVDFPDPMAPNNRRLFGFMEAND